MRGPTLARALASREGDGVETSDFRAPQRLFRLGYQEMPSTEQIVQLPLSAGDYINPYFAEDDPDYQS